MSDQEIPNRFDFNTKSADIYAAWKSNGCFNAEVNPDKKPFTIVIPPPNVTGALHLGHALNNTLQDIQIRMHRMMGFEALWMPGTDHAGIATQAVVEKRLKERENLTRHDLGRDALVQRIWDWKAVSEKRILGQLEQMGCSCDWRRTRFTLDDRCAKAVQATFFDLFRKDLIYRGKRLVNWDTFLQTAVSDDELFHEKVKGHFWHIKYKVIEPKAGEPKFVIIATTRPETLLGDSAVAVHPEPAAELDRVEETLKQKLAAATEKDAPAIELQLEQIASRKTELLPQLLRLAKMAADSRMLELPLVNRPIPLVADSWAKPEMGSGCVKITPAHDSNDYEVGLRNDLPMINILLPDGRLNEHAGDYAGLTINAARNRIVEDLENADLLDQVEDREIELAHSDRSKSPIEPYLADQWFVRMDALAQSAIDAVEDGRVQIFPPRYAKSYVDWLSEKRDWPVGRQLWWGHQIPIWSQSYLTHDEIKAARKKIEALIAEHPNQIACTTEDELTLHVGLTSGADDLQNKVESLGLERQTDVMDTWFSSALWPHSTLGWPDQTEELKYFYPTSTLITSRDIITLWVARMVLMGLNNMDQIPFNEVFIHPKILDGYGETMSKSKGNGVDPLDVIEKFGADALRFGLCWLTTETQDVRMPVQFECPHCQTLVNQTKQNRSQPTVVCDKCKQAFSTQWAETETDKAMLRAPVVSDRFETARNFTNKLWNAARFVMMNLQDFSAGPVAAEDLAIEDRWILSRLSTVTASMTNAIKQYRYADAARVIYDFAWDDFCSNYLEIAKPRLQADGSSQVVQPVLAHTLDHMMRLLHPIMPFVTEAIWQQLAAVASKRDLHDSEPNQFIMLADWPVARIEDQDSKIEEQFALFTALLGAIREIRSRQNLPPKQAVSYSVACDTKVAETLEPMLPFIASMATAQLNTLATSINPPAINAAITLEQMTVYVDLSSLIDKPAEIERNEKLQENLSKQIKAKRSKLGNEAFVARAPAEVVESERQSLADLEAKLQVVESALVTLRL